MSLSIGDTKVRVPPIAALGIALAAISTSAILIRLSDAPSLIKAFYRSLFTTVLLLPLVPVYRTELAEISRRDAVFAIASGAALAVHFATWFESLEWTSIAASVTLVQTQPIFVAIAAWALLDERLTWKMIVGIGVALAGSVVMSGGGFIGPNTVGANPVWGNFLAVSGALMAAGYVLTGRSLRQRISLVPYVVVVYSVATLGLFGFAMGSGLSFTGYPTHEWVLFLAMAIGPGLFGHTLINWALKFVESTVVSVSLLVEPLGSAFLALVVFFEVPSLWTVVGGAVVLTGIFLTARGRRHSVDGEQSSRN